MIILEQKVDAIIRLLTSESIDERKAARSELMRLMSVAAPETNDPEGMIRAILLDMGAPENLLGHAYAVEAIRLCTEDHRYIEQVTYKLYPDIAAKFDTTAARVERALRHLVTVIWNRADEDVLMRYFGNTVHPAKGKPTSSEFIARCESIVRMRVKNAQK